MSETPVAMEVTEDRLLGGQVLLRQPAEGYRVAIDPILLAAAVPAFRDELVLDLGCGVAAAAICLMLRAQAVRVMGLEMQRPLVRLAGENVLLNGMANRCTIMEGSLLQPPPRLSPGLFDHVMANPPHHSRATARLSGNPIKAISNVEGAAQLEDWVRVAVTMVRSKGTVSIVHRADRLDELLVTMRGRLGELVVYPLWPGGDKPAARVLVRGRKDVATPMRLASGLRLHDPAGGFTAAAEAILRDAAPLPL